MAGTEGGIEKFGWPKAPVLWRNCTMPYGSHAPAPDRSRVTRKAVVAALASLLLFSGCTTPRQAYVSQHPNLTPDQRRILVTGKLVDRDPVAGMTREEIRLTMGVDATQTTSINGEDALIWLKRKPEPLSMMEGTDRASGGTGSGSFSNIPRETDQTPAKKVNIRTTVFFQGDLATHVDVREEPATP